MRREEFKAPRIVLTAAIGLAGLLAPSSAGAAITIGSNLSTITVTGTACTGCTAIMVSHPSAQVASPIDGVVVRFRIRKASTVSHGSFSLRILRPAGGGAFTGVGTSPAMPTAGTPVISEFPVRLPIRAGDHIGVDSSNNYLTHAVTGSVTGVVGGGLPDGGPPVVPTPGFANDELLLNADVEPDCDNDGFGDETQDTDLTSCDVSPPDTTINKGPEEKTKKKQATFEFTGTDARTVASFQCSLDGGAFAACTSPHTVKVKKGKHTFSVRATDANGNLDGSPATDDWKVKKKKKK
jgi:hypothetical protein